MKRFWNEVRVDAARGVRLDDRPVRTPGRVALTLPSDALADAVAAEWRAVGEMVDPRAMPLTGLANAASDRVAHDCAAFASDLAAYGESDLLCYRAATPEPLVARQHALWNPPLDWARARYDVHFTVTTGIMHRPQPPATIARLGNAVASLSPFVLAGFSPLVRLTGSLVLALSLVEGAADADAVWTAATLDETWQAELWGNDAEAAAMRADRRRSFDAAVRFLALL